MEKNKVGRPMKFQSVEELQSSIDAYFSFVAGSEDEIPDIEGLAFFLDTTRKTLLDYEQMPEFSYTIKKAKDAIFYKKKQLAFKGKIHPTVFIFDSKNNHGYTDKQEIEHSGGTQIRVSVDDFND